VRESRTVRRPNALQLAITPPPSDCRGFESAVACGHPEARRARTCMDGLRTVMAGCLLKSPAELAFQHLNHSELDLGPRLLLFRQHRDASSAAQQALAQFEQQFGWNVTYGHCSPAAFQTYSFGWQLG
jgi:hypothetical protein